MQRIKAEKKYSLVITTKEVLLLRDVIKSALTAFPSAQFFASHRREEVIEMLGTLHVLQNTKGGDSL